MSVIHCWILSRLLDLLIVLMDDLLHLRVLHEPDMQEYRLASARVMCIKENYDLMFLQ